MREIAPWATAVLLGFAGFFTSLLVFYATPFSTTSPAPVEGVGLNPLLRHPSMMIHPPMLYSGYTLFTIPFAFAIGALITRRVDAQWIAATRRFALAAWFFLGVGILLGARWSYAELGWGGYWAWDPVENASLMPWLTATAFLHSVMIQEKRGMLKVWNVSLVLATGTLAIMGTFLVRSGILDSIHAFGASTLGVPFVVLIAILVGGSIALVVSRRVALRSEHRLDSLLSREAVFLVNNLVLVGLCFVIFWGTFFPLISEAVTGTKASVGPPWFNRYTVPLALVLVLLSGIGPVIAWRRATAANTRRNFVVPLLAAASTPGALLAVGGVARRPLALAMFCAAAFVVGSVGPGVLAWDAGSQAMTGDSAPAALCCADPAQPPPLRRLHRPRRDGRAVRGRGRLLGLPARPRRAPVTRSVGQRRGYDLRYMRPTASVASDPKNTGALLDLGAVIDVTRRGRHVVTLTPSRGYYPGIDPTQGSVEPPDRRRGHEPRRVAGRSTRDIWAPSCPTSARWRRSSGGPTGSVPVRAARYRPGAALAAIASRYVAHPPPAQFRFIDSPLITWIWLGGLIIFGGGLIALWPAPWAIRGRARARLPARLARDLETA